MHASMYYAETIKTMFSDGEHLVDAFYGSMVVWEDGDPDSIPWEDAYKLGLFDDDVKAYSCQTGFWGRLATVELNSDTDTLDPPDHPDNEPVDPGPWIGPFQTFDEMMQGVADEFEAGAAHEPEAIPHERPLCA